MANTHNNLMPVARIIAVVLSIIILTVVALAAWRLSLPVPTTKPGAARFERASINKTLSGSDIHLLYRDAERTLLETFETDEADEKGVRIISLSKDPAEHAAISAAFEVGKYVEYVEVLVEGRGDYEIDVVALGESIHYAPYSQQAFRTRTLATGEERDQEYLYIEPGVRDWSNLSPRWIEGISIYIRPAAYSQKAPELFSITVNVGALEPAK